jgi:hypothetical protein
VVEKKTKKTYGRVKRLPTGNSVIIPRGIMVMAMRAVKKPVRTVRVRRREIWFRVSPK